MQHHCVVSFFVIRIISFVFSIPLASYATTHSLSLLFPTQQVVRANEALGAKPRALLPAPFERSRLPSHYFPHRVRGARLHDGLHLHFDVDPLQQRQPPVLRPHPARRDGEEPKGTYYLPSLCCCPFFLPFCRMSSLKIVVVESVPPMIRNGRRLHYYACVLLHCCRFFFYIYSRLLSLL